VLYSIAIEDADGAVVHLDGQGERDGAARTQHEFAQSGVEVKVVGRSLEQLGGNVQWIEIFKRTSGGSDCWHSWPFRWK
jgi:hypothetical protein